MIPTCRRQVTVLSELSDKLANQFARENRVTRGAYKCVKKVKRQERHIGYVGNLI